MAEPAYSFPDLGTEADLETRPTSIPAASYAWMYLTKYSAYASWYPYFSQPRWARSLLSFIQAGALHRIGAENREQ